jgi:hypothetical protein
MMQLIPHMMVSERVEQMVILQEPFCMFNHKKSGPT